MKSIHVYKQYFAAECTFAGVERHGAAVWLTAESDNGRRSKKRDALYLAQVKITADEIANSLNGIINWDKPLNEAQYG